MDPQVGTGVTLAPGGTAILWEAPSKKAAVYFELDVVDRLNFDVMRGFGAVPRRGAEVGGFLLGTLEQGETAVVRIEDYVPISCEHSRGPSFILSAADLDRMQETLALWRKGPDRRIYAVGLYRSNTRESLLLAKEDFELLDTYFPEPFSVCLLIRPFATKPSQAAFLVREEGVFSTPGEPPCFSFRRRELGGAAPAARPARPRTLFADSVAARAGSTSPAPAAPAPAAPAPAPAQAPGIPEVRPPAEAATQIVQPPSAEPAADPPAATQNGSARRSGLRSGWVWLPLSFIFLLLGVVLGFQVAISLNSSRAADSSSDPYALELSAVKFGENIHLKWNTESVALRRAQRGALSIDDGGNTKTVELSRDDLARGSVLYRHRSGSVRFRLDIIPRERNTVSETLDVRLVAEPAAAGETPAETSPAKTRPRRSSPGR